MFISSKILLWVIKLIWVIKWWSTKNPTKSTHIHTRFRDAKIRDPKFESLIKRRVTLGLGMTMILLPRHRVLTLMSFILSCPVRKALDLRFNFDIARVGWWFMKMITRTAPTPPQLRFSYFGHDSSQGYSRFPVTKELSFVFLF